MQFRTIVSAFYLNGATSDPDLAALVEQVGLVGASPLSDAGRGALGFFEPDRVVLGGQWGVFQDTWAVLDEVEGLVCLQLYSFYGGFVEAARRDREHGTSRDGTLAYVETFGGACQRLDPRVALLDARAHYEDQQWEGKEGNRDWVLAQARLVAAADVNALADERVSVLYVSEPLMTEWESEPSRDNRDVIELPAGRLFFAWRGPARMA